jgi:hypothetical protein
VHLNMFCDEFTEGACVIVVLVTIFLGRDHVPSPKSAMTAPVLCLVFTVAKATSRCERV